MQGERAPRGPFNLFSRSLQKKKRKQRRLSNGELVRAAELHPPPSPPHDQRRHTSLLHLLTHMLLKCFFEGAQAGRELNASWNMCTVCVCLQVYMHGYYHVCALIAGVHLAAEPSSGAPGVGVARAPPTPSYPVQLPPTPPHALVASAAAALLCRDAPAHLNGADVPSLTSITPGGPTRPGRGGWDQPVAKINSVLPRKKIIFCSAADRVTPALCNKLMNVL